MAVIPPEFSYIERKEILEGAELIDIEQLPPDLVDEAPELEPIPPLTDEIMDNYVDGIRDVLDRIRKEVKTIEDCDRVISALDNILVPNIEYLAYKAKRLSEDLQNNVCDLAHRLTSSEEYVLHPSHAEEYKHVVKAMLYAEVSEYGMFAKRLAEKKRKSEAFIQQQKEQITHDTTAHLQFKLFFFTLELLSRGLAVTPNLEMNLALRKLSAEKLGSDCLKGLSRAEVNRLVYDGDSREADEIVDDLIAELRGNHIAVPTP